MTAAGLTAFQAAVAQQLKAQDTSGSVWVAASAGAGKTRVLTARIVRLLLEGASPAALVALTYTKAAAQEMAGRVIERARDLALAAPEARLHQVRELLDIPEQAVPPPEVMARAGSLYEHILDTPGGLQIQTLHAFCQSLLGRFPFEAGLTPGFEAIEEGDRNAILSAVCAQVLTRHPDRFGTLKSLVRGDALMPLADALVQVDWDAIQPQARLASFDAMLGGGFAGGSLRDLQQTMVADLAARAGTMTDLADLARRTGRATDEKLATCLYAALQAQDPLPILVRHFMTDGRAKSARSVHTKDLAGHPALDWLFATVPTRQARVQAQRLYDLNAQVMEFGTLIAASFSQEKARRAFLDFDDLIHAAGRLLAQDQGPTYVQYRLDQRLEHLLLDEAQDTSAAQWSLIAGLAEPFFDDASAMDDRRRTLFVVGDFKQSIYSFQGAAPKLFERSRRRFADLAGSSLRSVSMVHSFRSAPQILTFVDQVAADLGHGGLQIEDGGLPQHAAVQQTRAGLVQVWPVPADPQAPPQVDWHPPTQSQAGESRRVTLGRVMARHIHRLCYDPDWRNRGEAYLHAGRRVQPGDFLVLVQNRKSDFANALIGELKGLGVPVSGVDRLRLTGELVVQDLLALGEVCLQSGDDLALAALLKSPLFDIQESQLFDLAHPRAKGLSLWQNLTDKMPTVAAQIEGLANQVGHVSVYEFYANLLFTQGGRAAFLAHIGPEAEEVLSLFLDRARQFDRQDNGNLTGFLERERGSVQELKRDTSEASGQVRLMTAHGAKGLEAPIVLVPDLRSLRHAGANRPSDKILDISGVGPIWVPKAEFHRPQTAQAQAAAHAMNEEERERLFYVALTRAEERLIICTDQQQDDKPEQGKWAWYNRAQAVAAAQGEVSDFDLEVLGWPESQGWSWGQVPAVPSEAPDDADTLKRDEDLPKWLHETMAGEVAAPVARPSSLVAAHTSSLVKEIGPKPLNSLEEPHVLAPESRTQALQRGILIHAALEHLPATKPTGWTDRLGAFFARNAPDIAAEVQQAWVQEVMQALENPKLRQFFGPGSQAEVHVAGQVDGQNMVGQIDRLWIDPASRRVAILDYKTNRPPPTDPAQVPAVYRAQLRAYAQLVAPLYPGFEVQTYLFWTHSGALMALDLD